MIKFSGQFLPLPVYQAPPERVSVQAATQFPSQPPPKVRAGQLSLPSHLLSAKPNPKAILPLTDSQLANTDLTTLRTGNGTRAIIRDFVRASPDLSAAVAAYVRTGLPAGRTAVAKNPDGSFNPEATATLSQIITRMDVLNDYAIGYDDSMSIRSLCESWARELLMYGAMAGELVLDKARLPDKIQPISVTQIQFYPSSDGRKMRPVQKLSGKEINLDVPTFFMVSLDQDILAPYPASPLEAAIQGVLFSADFMNDIRRIVKKAIHPRMTATIDEEKFRKGIPPSIVSDPEKIAAYMQEVVSNLEQKMASLQPEDVLVMFDTIGVEVIDHGNTNLSNEYKVIQDLIDRKLATGAKVLPTVLGHSGGTSNTASSETLMFLKHVEGTVWAKCNEMLSKVLTLAVRLLGHDVVVDFSFDPIDLRPDLELESFRAMRQSRVLELLSLGMMTDEESSVRLTGHLPPPGYQKLAGTGFRPGTAVQPAGDGYNGASNSGSTLNQNLNSDAPKSPKSKNGGKKSPP